MALTAEDRHHHHRARIAALTRRHPDRPELAEVERRKLRAASAERYLRRLLEEPPALTNDPAGLRHEPEHDEER
jgi:hypothetical protein